MYHMCCTHVALKLMTKRIRRGRKVTSIEEGQTVLEYLKRYGNTLTHY